MGYNPMKHGAVVAIRIFFGDDRNPMAELAFAFGGSKIINWVNVNQRNEYVSGINGYTLIYDEREKADFSKFVKPETDPLKYSNLSKYINSHQGIKLKFIINWCVHNMDNQLAEKVLSYIHDNNIDNDLEGEYVVNHIPIKDFIDMGQSDDYMNYLGYDLYKVS